MAWNTFQSWSLILLVIIILTEVRALNYTLKLVQIIMRHGARTPYGEIPNHAAYWNCTLTGLEVPDQTSQPDINIDRIYRKNYIPDMEVLPGNCNEGELTQSGFNDQFDLGQKLREHYIDDLEFLSPTLNTSEIYVRSTDIPRTFKSAEANLLGLYPAETRNGSAQIIDIFTVEQSLEYLSPGNHCPVLVEMCNAVQNTTEWQLQLASMDPLQQKLAMIWNTTVEQLPWWIGLYGILESREGNGIAFPPGITPEIYEQITNFSVWEVAALYQSKEICKLGIGKLVIDVYNRMKANMEGPSSPKWILYSAHDTTVALVLNAFSVFDGTGWPMYASNVIFELLQDENGDYYVQMLYNGEPVLIPGCDGVICDFDIFYSIAAQLMPADWKKECGIKKGQAYVYNRSPSVSSSTSYVTEYLC